MVGGCFIIQVQYNCHAVGALLGNRCPDRTGNVSNVLALDRWSTNAFLLDLKLRFLKNSSLVRSFHLRVTLFNLSCNVSFSPSTTRLG